MPVGSGGGVNSVGVKGWKKHFFPPAVPSTTPMAFCTLPSFACIRRPRWGPFELSNRHLRSHGKIGVWTVYIQKRTWPISSGLDLMLGQ